MLTPIPFSLSPPGSTLRLPQQKQLFPLVPQHPSSPAIAAAEPCHTAPLGGAATAASQRLGQGDRKHAGRRHSRQSQPALCANGGWPDREPGRKPADAHQRDPGESQWCYSCPAAEPPDTDQWATYLAALHQLEQVRWEGAISSPKGQQSKHPCLSPPPAQALSVQSCESIRLPLAPF